MIKQILFISLSAILVENFVLVKFLGICPFLGVSKKVEMAFGMGMAVTFVMTLASLITWLLNSLLLEPFELEYIRTLAFILVIAALVQFVEMAMRKMVPSLYRALGIYLPLITTNCAVLGVALLNVDYSYGLVESVIYGTTAAIGFTLAIVLLAGITERLELANIPAPLKGFPITLIAAALISIAFMGFQNLGF